MFSECLKLSFIGLKRKCLFKLAVVNKIAAAEILCLQEGGFELPSFKTSLFQIDFVCHHTPLVREEIRILQPSVDLREVCPPIGTLHFLEVCESAKANAAVLLVAQITYCCLLAISSSQAQHTQSRKEV